MVGMLGAQEPGVARAEEHAAARKRGALGNQGLHQRLRLRAGLAPDERVAGAHDARKLQRSSPSSLYDAGSEIGSMCVNTPAFGTIERMRDSISSESWCACATVQASGTSRWNETNRRAAPPPGRDAREDTAERGANSLESV